MTTAYDAALDPHDYVDREEHQSLLTDVIAGRQDLRALLITDGSGQGKSDLMMRLRLNCLEDENRPSVFFADVRDLSAAFGVVERSYGDTRNRPAYKTHFGSFSAEYIRWLGTLRVDVSGHGGSVHVDAANAHVGDSGALIGVQVTGAPAGVGSIAAQNSILEAFQRDLEAPRDRVLVIMIDHYNRSDPPVRTWIDEMLLQPCLDGDLPNVVIVLASTPDRRPSYPARLSHLVVEKPLTRLEDDPRHVRNLLRAHRLVAEDEDDEGLVQQSMSLLRDYTISGVLSLYRSKLDTGHGG